LAVGGGGQFHHLREPREIVSAFSGELGELFAVAARDVRLEVECAPGIELEVISDYWTRREQGDHPNWSIAVGDLIAGDERHVVLRLGFPPRLARVEPVVRVRLVWSAAGARSSTPWSAFDFRYADDAACSAEPRDEEVARWAARQQADRALKEATVQSRRGNAAAAQAVLSQARQRVAPQAAGDAELSQSLAEMDAMQQAVASAPLASATAKESLSRAQRRLRGQRDLRES
ncbi:MAG TPA: hypothetical protein VFI42_04110, partial [Thermomicrobiaceae bacterium]|nr:hypothetical protein [Thermomicrobiaceae bacterium]